MEYITELEKRAEFTKEWIVKFKVAQQKLEEKHLSEDIKYRAESAALKSIILDLQEQLEVLDHQLKNLK